jgi:hypothetical protein
MAGRKPIGEVAMSGAERVRRHRQAEHQRKAKAVESGPGVASLPDSSRALAPQPNPDQILIERLTVERDEARRERDHAWRERNDLRRELEVARGGVLIPAPALVEACSPPRWCAFCRNRWSNDPGVRMVEGGAQQHRLFICSECVQTCVGILGGPSPRLIR